LAKTVDDNICEEHIFNRIYQNCAKDLHHYLYYRFGEKTDPADKTQEAFVKLWEHCAKVTLSAARSYLFKIANNLTLNELKHQKVVLRHQQQATHNYTNETPEFLLEETEYARKFQDALSNLSEEQRVAFMLNKVEGKKHQEIAEMLGVSRKVIEYRIYSAFNHLKKVLEGFS
jgi:RNA polymerase sigma-70 factor (ECF subfamily)